MKRQIIFCALLFSFANVISQYSRLYDFTLMNDLYNTKTTPVYDGEYLYGISTLGGKYRQGAIFKVRPDGTGYAKLLDFDGDNGSQPCGDLFLAGHELFGVTQGQYAGSGGCYLYKINTDGSGYTQLRKFISSIEGTELRNSVTVEGNIIYGVSQGFGSEFHLPHGYLYKINTDGTGYHKIYEFEGNSNVEEPIGKLVVSGCKLYGMTYNGGDYNMGSIYSVDTNGTGYIRMFDFNGSETGSRPEGSLVLSGCALYGMTSGGGLYDYGCIFKIHTDGTTFTKILDFDGENSGKNPVGSLTVVDNALFGLNSGCIFKINTDGSGLFILKENFDSSFGSLLLAEGIFYGSVNFTQSGPGGIFRISSDGSDFSYILLFSGNGINGNFPQGSLTYSHNYLYGAAGVGGISQTGGCIFRLKSDGSDYTKLKDFSDPGDGRYPTGSLILQDSILYGVTRDGGQNGMGCIFKLDTNGTGYSRLFDFNGAETGSHPRGSLAISGSTLYGLTYDGGNYNMGCIFRINTDGTGFKKLVDFNGPENGRFPEGTLVLSGSLLYGSTSFGGQTNRGCIFSIDTSGADFEKILECKTYGSLTITDSVIYGASEWGGTNNNGYIFRIRKDGTGYEEIYYFENRIYGKNPFGPLVLVDDKLFGMTNTGGQKDHGCLFYLSLDSMKYHKLSEFDGIHNGRIYPGLLTYAEYSLFGLTYNGGINDVGTVFKYKLDSIIATPKKDQFIIFNPIPTKTYGDPDFVLEGIASSGLPLSYSTSDSGIIIIEGSELFIVSAGTTIITASQPGDSIFNQAAEVMQSITVNKADQWINFDPLPVKSIDDTSFCIEATATSLLNVDFLCSDTAIACINGKRVFIKGCGSTEIVARQPGNMNYNAAPDVSHSLIVTSVSATSETRNEGILIYPNPLSRKIYIKSPDMISRVELYNANSVLLWHSDVNSYETAIDIDMLPAGFFVIKVQSRGRVFTQILEKN